VYIEQSFQRASLLKDLNMYIIFGITLTAIMGVTSIAPALPSISRSLGVSTDQIGLLITFFTIPGILFTPVLGIMADRFGRKRVLVPSLFLFGLAGTACAFSTSFEQLLLFRFFQGTGGAALGVLNLTLIGDLYPKNIRATVMGYNGGVLSVGTTVYPAVGGALTLLGWHYPFYLTLLAIPVGLFTLISLQTQKLSKPLKLQLYFNEIKSALSSRLVAGLFTGIFLTFIILYGGYITFFTILLDERFNQSALMIGIILSSSSIITAYTSSQLGRLTTRFSEHTLITVASVLYFFIFLSIPFIENIWWFILPISAFGIAQGINIPSILNLITGYAKKDFRAAFLSINWVIMRLGQALGPYLLGIVYLHFKIDGTFYATTFIAAIFVCVSVLLISPGINSTKNQIADRQK
jgi:MFS transporter, ACDE family, multidrug resistance protein